MNTADVVMYFVVAVVGMRWIATAAAVGPSALVIWLIGFLALFVPLGFVVVELSSRYPEEGGVYVWTQRAFGDYAAFLTGWMYWTTNLAYFPGLLYFSVASGLFAFGERGHALASNAPFFIGASLVGLVIALVPNLVGLGIGKWLHNLGALCTWAPIALLVAAGFIAFARFGSATAFTARSLVPGASFADLVLISTITFAFGGFEAASFMGDEIHDPRRTVPRAVLLSGAIIMAIYVLGTLAVLLALPHREVTGLQGIMAATERAAARIGMPWITPVSAWMIAVGGIGGLGAWLTAGARVSFVAGADRYLPAAFGRIHPRWGTPYIGLLAQGAGAALFIVLGQAGTGVKGAYDALVALTAITYFIPMLILFAAHLALQREPVSAGTLRAPGGKPVAILLGTLGFATTLVSLVLAAIPPSDSNNPALATLKVLGGTLLLIVLGSALYWRGRAARRR